MLPGPVFNFELSGTARRPRFFLIRAFYAAILLLILWSVHVAWTSETGGELPSYLVNWFAFSTFCGIVVGQEILVLALTPTLVAGVIADEKQRKTLNYLLTSRLTSPEIVLGKLFARMLYVGVLLGVSLPVLSLLVLLGGIDPRLVLLACGATFSTAWFLAALSAWTSTVARRVREACLIAYGLELLWLLLPMILQSVLVPRWPVFDTAASWLADWVGRSSPVEVARLMFWDAVGGGISRWTVLELTAWMIGLQAAFGVVLSALAAWQLRPIFRRQGGEGGRATRALRWLLQPWHQRRFRRPRIPGERPVIWKELHTGHARGLTRLVAVLLTLIGGGFLAYWAVWYGFNALLEMWETHDASSWGYTSQPDRWAFYWFLVGSVPLIYLVGILAVASAAASTITSEHEGDTWISLTVTDLTGREIVFAKLLGALMRGRRCAEVILLLAAIGVVAKSAHVLSLPLLVIALLVYGWFAASFGVWISLQFRSTWRAQFLTITTLLLINFMGQGILNAASRFGYAAQLWPGLTPYEITRLLPEPQFLDHLSSAFSRPWARSWRLSDIDDGLAWQAVFTVLSILCYTLLATLLNRLSLRRFEIVAGRARQLVRPRSSTSTHGKSKVKVSSIVEAVHTVAGV
jgi:ABC-type transport system involved in multi-copper enzyme maturation permease subunit